MLRYVFLCFLLFVAFSCADGDSSSSSSLWYWSSSWYTAKPPKLESSSSYSPYTYSTANNSTYSYSSTSTEEEELPIPDELVYENLPFIVGIQSKKDDDKGSLFLGNITSYDSGNNTIYAGFISSQMDVLLTPMMFSSDCNLYVGINSGWSVYDWRSLTLIDQVQVNQTGYPYTPTTRGFAFDLDNNIVLVDPYGTVSSYYTNGTLMGVLGDLNLHGHVSSMLFNDSMLYVGVYGAVLAYSYPELQLNQTFYLPNSSNSEDLDVYSLSFYGKNSSLIYALNGEGVYLVNTTMTNETSNTQVESVLSVEDDEQLFSLQYVTNSNSSSLNGLLVTNSYDSSLLMQYAVTNASIVSNETSVFAVDNQENIMRFLVVPDVCTASAPTETPNYPPVVGTYNETDCSLQNLTSVDYGANATVLSCSDLGSSLTVVSQSGSVIVIQIDSYSTPSNAKDASTTNITVEGTITAGGNVYFTIPLPGTSFAQCSGDYVSEALEFSCLSYYEPESGANVPLAKTTTTYTCQSGDCATNPSSTGDGSLWWIALVVVAVAAVLLIIVGVAGFAVYRKQNNRTNYDIVE